MFAGKGHLGVRGGSVGRGWVVRKEVGRQGGCGCWQRGGQGVGRDGYAIEFLSVCPSSAKIHTFAN